MFRLQWRWLWIPVLTELFACVQAAMKMVVNTSTDWTVCYEDGYEYQYWLKCLLVLRLLGRWLWIPVLTEMFACVYVFRLLLRWLWIPVLIEMCSGCCWRSTRKASIRPSTSSPTTIRKTRQGSQCNTAIWCTNIPCNLPRGSQTRVSQFRFKKNFASKRNLAKQKQFRFVSLQFRETTKKVSLHFASFRFASFASFC